MAPLSLVEMADLEVFLWDAKALVGVPGLVRGRQDVPMCPGSEGEVLRYPYRQFFADFWSSKFGSELAPLLLNQSLSSADAADMCASFYLNPPTPGLPASF